MSNIRFSQLPTVVSLKDSDLFAISSPDTSTPPVYTSAQSPISQVAAKIVEGTTFTTSMPTTNKTVAGAIQEMYGTVLTDTLEAGETTLTFTNQAITTNSTLDNIWASVFGIFPTNAVFATGSLTLTFDAQANDIEIKVRIT